MLDADNSSVVLVCVSDEEFYSELDLVAAVSQTMKMKMKKRADR